MRRHTHARASLPAPPPCREGARRAENREARTPGPTATRNSDQIPRPTSFCNQGAGGRTHCPEKDGSSRGGRGLQLRPERWLGLGLLLGLGLGLRMVSPCPPPLFLSCHFTLFSSSCGVAAVLVLTSSIQPRLFLFNKMATPPPSPQHRESESDDIHSSSISKSPWRELVLWAGRHPQSQTPYLLVRLGAAVRLNMPEEEQRLMGDVLVQQATHGLTAHCLTPPSGKRWREIAVVVRRTLFFFFP